VYRQTGQPPCVICCEDCARVRPETVVELSAARARRGDWLAWTTVFGPPSGRVERSQPPPYDNYVLCVKRGQPAESPTIKVQ